MTAALLHVVAWFSVSYSERPRKTQMQNPGSEVLRDFSCPATLARTSH